MPSTTWTTLLPALKMGWLWRGFEYEYGQDPDEKYQEMVREVNALRCELPADIFRIEIRKFSPTDVSIVQVALQSEVASDKELGEQADRLKEQLEKVKTLKNVAVGGSRKQQCAFRSTLKRWRRRALP